MSEFGREAPLKRGEFVHPKNRIKMSLLKYSLGIDVDSQKLKCCLGSIDTVQVHKVLASRTFENGLQGFKELVLWLKKHCKEKLPVVITMEVTGVYHEQLANYLHEEGYVVSVVLANRAKKYMESLGFKSKTDKIDARGLSRMGAEQSLERWRPIREEILALRSLTRHRQALTEALTVFSNQQHAQDHMRLPSKEVLASQAKMMKTIKAQIAAVDQKIK